MRNYSAIEIARAANAEQTRFVEQQRVGRNEVDMAAVALGMVVVPTEIVALEPGDGPRVGGQHSLLVSTQRRSRLREINDHNAVHRRAVRHGGSFSSGGRICRNEYSRARS